MRTISLKLSDDLLAELEREASNRRITKSVLVRESLEAALRGRPRRRVASCYDLARGLAGTVKGLPRDLAHNLKYPEIYGGLRRVMKPVALLDTGPLVSFPSMDLCTTHGCGTVETTAPSHAHM